MKTALQEAIERVTTTQEKITTSVDGMSYKSATLNTLKQVKDMLDGLLWLEKQQIERAYYAGYSYTEHYHTQTSSDYFKTNYSNE